MSSVNKAIIAGNLGADPDIRKMQSGDDVCNLSIATSEKWKDKNGEKQERTQWHKVVLFNKGSVNLARYASKGDKVYVEGPIEYRKWTDQNGVEKYTTEIVVRPFGGDFKILQSEKRDNQSIGYSEPISNDLEDEIPF